jgi:hypothetical protein
MLLSAPVEQEHAAYFTRHNIILRRRRPDCYLHGYKSFVKTLKWNSWKLKLLTALFGLKGNKPRLSVQCVCLFVCL